MGLAIAVAITPSAAAPASTSRVSDAIGLYEAGRYQDALPLFQDLAQREPANSVLWIWLAATYLHLGRLPQAKQTLEQTIRVDAQNGAAYLFLAVVHYRMGQQDMARTLFARARTYAPNKAYLASVDQWLAFLARAASGPAGKEPSVPSPSQVSCPKPEAPVAPKPPASVNTPPGARLEVEIIDWNFLVEGQRLHLEGEVNNNGDNEVRDIRLLAIGFDLHGRQVARAAARLSEPIDQGDVQDFTITFVTQPPVMWVQLQVVDYQGRRTGADLHRLTIPVDVDAYDTLAETRIKVAASVLPPGTARAHTICLIVSDAAGFPIQAAQVRLAVEGDNPRQRLQQSKDVRVSADQGGSVLVTWSDPVSVTVKVAVKSVQFSPLPGL